MTFTRTFFLFACVLLLAVCAVAQEAAAPAQAAAAEADANAASQLRVGAGDLIEVSVFGVPEMTQTTRISNSGEVTLALVGPMRIGGLSVEEAQRKIRTALVEGGFLKSPHVSLLVKEFATQGTSVLGEVNKPGIYPLMGQRRLFDVISAAGGTTPKAGRSVTITRREAPQTPINVNLPEDPADAMASNVEVFPGDTVLVSRAGIVYVVGDVSKPGGFVLEGGKRLTVLQAIAMAQGVNRTAALGSAKVIRKSANGMEEVPIRLNKILAAKEPDLALKEDDILFVPGSAAKGAAKRGLDAVMQIATGVTIYR